MRFVFVIFAALLLTGAQFGCSFFSGSGNENTAPEVSGEVPVYTDAAAALAGGTKYLDTGETEKAINALNQAVKLDPDLAEAYFRLGVAYSLIEFSQQLGDEAGTEPAPAADADDNGKERKKPNSVIAFERAVEAYKKLIDANPEDHAAHYNLGRAYSKLNKDQDAARALRTAVDLKPDDTEYQTELGTVLINLAKYHEAVGALKKAIEIDPGNLEAEDLLERAEAGRKRISFTELPGDDKKEPEDNTNANTVLEKPPTPLARPSPSREAKPSPKPTASKPPA
jgi:tetratricopeptide (TPR) repeat protein